MTYSELKDNARMCAKGTGNAYERGLILAKLAQAEATMQQARMLEKLANHILDAVRDQEEVWP